MKEVVEGYIQYLQDRPVELDARVRRYLICKAFHWDYYTYQSQPDKFIIDVWAMLSIDLRKEKQLQQASVRQNSEPQVRRGPQIRRAPRTRISR